jgi:DNA polymerase elongation subunit (family B)
MEEGLVYIKSKETQTGVCFRVMKPTGEFSFVNIPFKNYFYIERKKENSVVIFDVLRDFKFALEKVKQSENYFKIILSNNFMRGKIKQYIEERTKTYEADINANKRYLIDNEIKLNNQLIPYTFFDIETDDRLPLQKDNHGNIIANSEILTFSAVNHKGEIFFAYNEGKKDSEKQLIKYILEYFNSYGIISGWNSSNFDLPYIIQRANKYEIDTEILDFINHIDYLELFKKYDKKSRPSFSLNNIANEVLKELKIEQKKGNGAIYNTWKENLKQLEQYNIEDSNLIYKINVKSMFIEVSMKRADYAGCHVVNTLKNSDSGDYLLLREYKKNNIIMPSKPTKAELEMRKAEGSIGGGYTTCFEPGMHENVKIWDYKSEYPSVIQTWNISPETFIKTIKKKEDLEKYKTDDYIITPDDFEGVYHPHRVYSKKQGVIPMVVKKLVELRDTIKYTMNEYIDKDPDKYRQLYLEQYGYKTDANSVYGIMSFPMSRYYSWDLGDSVTTSARATLKACNEVLRSNNCVVIGGDTDSTFVKTEVSPAILNGIIEKFLVDWGNKFGCINNKLVFEFEKVFDRMLFIKKKHYAFKIKDKIVIKGMESIKSDSNYLASVLQKELIYNLLNDEYDRSVWEKKILEIRERIFNKELTLKELVMVKSISKLPREYKGFVIDKNTGKAKQKLDGEKQKKSIPAHVNLAERMIENGAEIYPGSKIQYIVVKNSPIIAVSLEEYQKQLRNLVINRKDKVISVDLSRGYDANYYWERIKKPLLKIFEVINEEIEVFLVKKKQNKKKMDYNQKKIFDVI